MANEQTFDLIVIGAGPGGYVAAIRAAQLGMKVACIEKDKTLGGTCLNVGCIPSKALLESTELFDQAQHKLSDHGIAVGSVAFDLAKMMARKDAVVKQLTGGIAGLFKKNKITAIFGNATIQKDKSVLVTQGAETVRCIAPKVLIATGSVPVSLPGVTIDQESIVDSTGALALKSVPKKMIVIGGGYIGLELGSVYRRLGTEVIVVEALDRIVPAMDGEVRTAFQKILQKQGFSFRVSTKVKKVTKMKSGVEVVVEADGKEEAIAADVVLVSIGRKPNTQGLGLENVDVKLAERGQILVNEKFETNVPGIFAVGDVIPGPMLAHKSSEEGVAAVEMMAGHKGHVNYFAIPGVVYTWPEAASVGFTEEQAKDHGLDYKVSKFPFLANGRAIALGEKDGFVKLISHKKTDRLIGAHILGPRASDLIAELVLAIESSATATSVAQTVHAHPTLAEAVKEAALGLGTGVIHF